MLGGDPLDLGVFVGAQAHGGHLLPFGRRLGGARGGGRRSWSARTNGEDYESLKDTAYLMRSPTNARRLLDAMERPESGRGETHDLLETD